MAKFTSEHAYVLRDGEILARFYGSEAQSRASQYASLCEAAENAPITEELPPVVDQEAPPAVEEPSPIESSIDPRIKLSDEELQAKMASLQSGENR